MRDFGIGCKYFAYQRGLRVKKPQKSKKTICFQMVFLQLTTYYCLIVFLLALFFHFFSMLLFGCTSFFSG
jgi:hypothetical protein